MLKALIGIAVVVGLVIAGAHALKDRHTSVGPVVVQVTVPNPFGPPTSQGGTSGGQIYIP